MCTCACFYQCLFIFCWFLALLICRCYTNNQGGKNRIGEKEKKFIDGNSDGDKERSSKCQLCVINVVLLFFSFFVFDLLPPIWRKNIDIASGFRRGKKRMMKNDERGKDIEKLVIKM